jgi:hypothetical protein
MFLGLITKIIIIGEEYMLRNSILRNSLFILILCLAFCFSVSISSDDICQINIFLDRRQDSKLNGNKNFPDKFVDCISGKAILFPYFRSHIKFY